MLKPKYLLPVAFVVVIIGTLFLCNTISVTARPPLTAKLPTADNDDVVWEGRPIKDWRWDLRDFRNVAKCATASHALARAGKIAVPGLSKDVNDGSVFLVNVWAAQALVRIGPQARDALPALKTAVKTAQERGKSHMGWRNFEPWGRAAIVKIDGKSEDHIEKIALLLRDNDELVKINACRALGQLSSLAKPALPALEQAKRDAKKSVQQCAAESIAAIESGR